MAEPTELSPAPLRSPVFDRGGRMTAEWQRYFMQLFHVSANAAAGVVTVTEKVTDVESASVFDARTPQDASAIAEDAAAGVPAGTARDFSPAIEDVLRSQLQHVAQPQVARADLDDIYARLASLESPNRGSAANASVSDFDPAGAAISAADQSPQPLFKDFGPDIEAAVRQVLMDARTPRVTPADLDELRSLIASLDPRRGAAWLSDQDANAYSLYFSNFGNLSGPNTGLYFRSPNASWDEFRVFVGTLAPGLANDVLAIQANARTTAGGADSWQNPIVIQQGTATPKVTVGNELAVGGKLTILSTTAGFGFEAWTSWTPTVTASGAMTVSSLSNFDAQYCKIGAMVFFKIELSMTLGGTASNQVYVSLPVASVGADVACQMHMQNAAITWTAVFGFTQSANSRVVASLNNNANWALGSAWVFAEGFYRCA
jgi:hypothetical protein